VTGARAPDSHRGVPQIPLHGASIAATFTDGDAPAPRARQYFEQMGHRGLWSDGWKITTYHEPGADFDDDEWALFHLDADFSECHDLSAEHPERLRAMIDEWWVEAGQFGVLPLDDRSTELFAAPPRPGTVHARSEYVYVPPMSHVPADAAPPLGGRPWTVTADVTIGAADGAGMIEGVLYARGSHNVGHSFFVRDGILHFDYNALGTHHRVSAPLALPLVAGRHALAVRFERVERRGKLTLTIDGADAASVDVPRIVRMLGSTGLDVGLDRLSPVVDDYDAPFPFTGGTIDRLTFRIHRRPDAADVAATAMAELSKE
jgi:arylsulfatase